MGKTVSALFVKFIYTMGAAWIALRYIDTNPGMSIFFSAALAFVLNYVADIIILPSRSSLMTTAADFILTFASAYIVSLLVPQFNPNLIGVLIFALIVAAIEYFFHSYLMSEKEIEPK
ncbi:DUF2512 family protein [Alkalicella caledoniensis]|uniref:DUF2512 family protein n=1 Tax=Alkalicella caledoniensis TaxID=2731377 RepID=A0A7G9W5H5_ALKCA|nr:DUF2512 family protein [Alkalicella caledoniensis]QNO13937.1 DUF2512 family protein [Alkalicella caledoniensis]